MLIRVRGIYGKIFEIVIEYDSSIAKLKQSIADKEGIPTGIFFLVYAGKVLKEDKLLTDYRNITRDSVLTCVERPSIGF